MSQLERETVLRHLLRHIEANLTEPLTLSGLAREAGCSPWHCSRLFREMLGLSPFAYIRRRRLTEAALRLRYPGERILDVALDFLFDSHEGFTRAFGREFGLSPSLFQRGKPVVRAFLPEGAGGRFPGLRKGGTSMEENRTEVIFAQVVERPARRLVLKRGIRASDYFGYCEEVGCEVWERLGSIAGALYEPAGFWLPPPLRERGSEYVMGVEVDATWEGTPPEGFEVLDLPPCRMMLFQGEPFADEDFDAAIKRVWAAIERYRPELHGFVWAPEDAPRFQLAPEGYRGYIEGRPVRHLS